MFKPTPGETRPALISIIGFLLPSIVLFCWFFFGSSTSFNLVSVLWLFLVALAGVLSGAFRNFHQVRVGAVWLLAGCGVAFFCALFLASLD